MSIKRFFNLKWWVSGITVITLIIGISTYVYIDGELGKMYGGDTTVIKLKPKNNGPKIFAINNVNVLTPDSQQFLNGRTVVIKNGLIESISTDTMITADMTVVDGQGQFLVPGYTDSHVHLWESENDLLLYIANGVTQIREMNGSAENLRWKKEINAGRLGPDMFVASPQIANFGKTTGWFAAWTQNKKNATSTKEFERAIKSFEASGYDAIKVSSMLTSEDYQMLNNAAKNSRLPMIGHYPYFGTLDDLWDSDQTELAHVEEIAKALRREYGYTNETAHGFLDFVKNRVDEISVQLVENNISVTTTMNLIDSLPKQVTNLESVLEAVHLDYVNPGISEGTDMADRALGWHPEVNRYRLAKDLNEKERQKEIQYYKIYSKALHLVFDSLLRNGVSIMAGTDSNVPVMVPGFSLHEEMKTLSEAGMSNAQVLASATTVPARWSNSNTGQISPGYKANLVLLTGNPLKNIGHTSAIQTVIINGRIMSRNDLDELLRLVKAANDEVRKVDI